MLLDVLEDGGTDLLPLDVGEGWEEVGKAVLGVFEECSCLFRHVSCGFET
jgi:hypothetical protein